MVKVNFPPKRPAFVPSPYQQAIFDFVKDESRGSAVINAVAGSGKTTTIVEALKLVPRGRSVTFLAFNKNIVEELKSRVAAGAQICTFNSLGHRALLRAHGQLVLDTNKVKSIIRGVATQLEWGAYGASVNKLVASAKTAGLGYLVPDEVGTWQELIDRYEISPTSMDAKLDRLISLSREVLAKSTAEKKVIDFNDQLYHPLIENLAFQPQDYVFVDESQDLNDIQHALLKRLVKRGTGRLIAVGDRRQSIYRFRGAVSSSMDRLRDRFKATELPLSVSYRCAKEIVAEARSKVNGLSIQPHESAETGKVESRVKLLASDFQGTDAILCRNSKPLIEFAFRLIRRMVPVLVVGRDIGQGLVTLVNSRRAKSIEDLEEKIERWRDREVAKWLSKDMEDKAEAANDRAETIKVIIDHVDDHERLSPPTVSDVTDAINRLFDDTPSVGKVTLSTIHKAKGLEWNRVYLLDPYLVPSRWARRPEEIEQELNLLYVAITRAKLNLVYINSGLSFVE